MKIARRLEKTRVSFTIKIKLKKKKRSIPCIYIFVCMQYVIRHKTTIYSFETCTLTITFSKDLTFSFFSNVITSLSVFQVDVLAAPVWPNIMTECREILVSYNWTTFAIADSNGWWFFWIIHLFMASMSTSFFTSGSCMVGNKSFVIPMNNGRSSTVSFAKFMLCIANKST